MEATSLHWPMLARLCPCPACRISWLWLGSICIENLITALASACLAVPLPCMSYQLALAGKHLLWKPRHCIGLCMPCCVPDLHVVPAGIGWEAFPLETMSMCQCAGYCLTRCMYVVQLARARYTWDAWQQSSHKVWPLPVSLHSCSACRDSWLWLGSTCDNFCCMYVVQQWLQYQQECWEDAQV